MYRAVMHIYAGAFEKALSDLDQSSGIMHANKVLQPKNQFGDDEPFDGPDNDNQSQGSSQTDLSDVGLCSLNIHEFSYNRATRRSPTLRRFYVEPFTCF